MHPTKGHNEAAASRSGLTIRYVLRYLKAVQMIKKIIEENNLHVMATFARWIMAYPGGIKMVRVAPCLMSAPVVHRCRR